MKRLLESLACSTFFWFVGLVSVFLLPMLGLIYQDEIFAWLRQHWEYFWDRHEWIKWTLLGLMTLVWCWMALGWAANKAAEHQAARHNWNKWNSELSEENARLRAALERLRSAGVEYAKQGDGESFIAGVCDEALSTPTKVSPASTTDA